MQVGAAAELRQLVRGGNVEFPLGKGRLNVRLRRGERDFARGDRFERADVLRVNDFHGECLVPVFTAWQRDEQAAVLFFRFDRLAVHIGGPELGAGRQREALKLLVVVFHHERRLREHLPRLSHHRRQLRAVGDGVEHRQFIKSRNVDVQLIGLATSVAVGQQHRVGN